MQWAQLTKILPWWQRFHWQSKMPYQLKLLVLFQSGWQLLIQTHLIPFLILFQSEEQLLIQRHLILFLIVHQWLMQLLVSTEVLLRSRRFHW